MYDHQCRCTSQNWGKKVGGNPDVTQQSMAMDMSLNLWLMLMTIIWKQRNGDVCEKLKSELQVHGAILCY